MYNKIKYSYFNDWVETDKIARSPLSKEEALRKYNTEEHIFVLCGNVKSPFALLSISGKNRQNIHFLGDKKEDLRSYSYQILHNIDNNRLCLTMFRDLVKVDDKHIKTYIHYFALSEKNKWKILESPYTNRYDVATRNVQNYYSDMKVDIESLWEDIPEFGNWDHLLRDDSNRIRFIED